MLAEDRFIRRTCPGGERRLWLFSDTGAGDLPGIESDG